MLRRLYADNFRCLVNFELKLDRLALFLGENGSGKTTVLDLLHRLRQFLLGECTIQRAFPSSSYTRWQNKNTQDFELDLLIGDELFAYHLTVGRDSSDSPLQVQRERLTVNTNPVFEVAIGTARLHEVDGSTGTEFPFDPAQSVIGSYLPNTTTRFINRFRNEIAKFVICSLQPTKMRSVSREESRLPDRSMENFVSWYRYLSQEYQGAIFKMIGELRLVLPGFHSFSLREYAENSREMRVQFQSEANDGLRTAYTFKELSDGQRVLIVLYTLLYGLEERGGYLFLDEPENFVALREIQPWLIALTDLVGGAIKQVVIISHHPEMIDYLGPTAGRWFERKPGGPARISDQMPAIAKGFKLSELMARGWER